MDVKSVKIWGIGGGRFSGSVEVRMAPRRVYATVAMSKYYERDDVSHAGFAIREYRRRSNPEGAESVKKFGTFLWDMPSSVKVDDCTSITYACEMYEAAAEATGSVFFLD